MWCFRLCVVESNVCWRDREPVEKKSKSISLQEIGQRAMERQRKREGDVMDLERALNTTHLKGFRAP